MDGNEHDDINAIGRELQNRINSILNELIYDALDDDNDQEIRVDEDDIDLRRERIIRAIAVLSLTIGRLSVNYSLLSSDDPSLKNATMQYYEMLAKNLGREICNLAEIKAKSLC